MKTLICCFLLFTIQIFSQSYLNVLFTNNSYKHSEIGSIKKITISSDNQQMIFYLNDATSWAENISDIKKITLDNLPLGEPLPVELSLFTFNLDGQTVILRWRTETEVRNFGFEIQRALKHNHWEKIGFVQGYGNSNSPKEYSFTDNPEEGLSLHYRLKQIDTDGKYQYSRILKVDVSTPSQFELKQNFPNPFNPSTHITYSLPSDGFVTIKVYDIVGSEIVTLVNEEKNAGSYYVEFEGVNLSSGVYLCTMIGKDFIKTIKMLMVK